MQATVSELLFKIPPGFRALEEWGISPDLVTGEQVERCQGHPERSALAGAPAAPPGMGTTVTSGTMEWTTMALRGTGRVN